MKLKGISVVEQHVEKIVLGVFAVILLGAFAWQFIGNPNAVQVGTQTVSPDKAPDIVRDMARTVKGKLESPTAPPVPEQPSILEEVRSGLAQSAQPPAPIRLAGLVGGSAPLAPRPVTPGGQAPASEGEMFAVFTPPAPTGVTWAMHEGTIDPVLPMRVKEAAAFLPKEQPFDKRSVTVRATIDAKAIREGLQRPTGGQPLPAAWWNAKVEVLDVELQRQTKGADGSWGETQTIVTIPGAFSMRERLRDPNTRPADLAALLDAERNNRQSVRRAPYWPVISGTAWTPPGEAGAATGAPADIERRARQVRVLKEELNRMAEQLKRLEAPPAPGREDPEADDRGGGGGGGGGGKPPGGQASAHPSSEFDSLRGVFAMDGIEDSIFTRDTWAQAGGGRGGRGDEEEAVDRREAQKKQLQKRIEDTTKKLAAEVADLEKAGYDETGAKIGAQQAQFVEPLGSITESATEKVTVWSHDVTAEPGKTYRYRLVAWLTNPLFGNGAGLSEKQRDLAKPAAVPSEPSEWTPAVEVRPDTVFVFTSAREPGTVGAGSAAIYSEASASAELFRFYYGYWRRGTVEMRPGDAMRATLTLPELSTFAVETGPNGEPNVAGAKTTPLPKTLRAGVDLTMLDVQAAQSGGAAILVRNKDGGLEMKSPEGAAAASALNASAQAGTKAVLAPLGRSMDSGAGTPGTPGTPGGLPPSGGSDGGDVPGDRDGPGRPPRPPGEGGPGRPGGKPPG